MNRDSNMRTRIKIIAFTNLNCFTREANQWAWPSRHLQRVKLLFMTDTTCLPLEYQCYITPDNEGVPEKRYACATTRGTLSLANVI